MQTNQKLSPKYWVVHDKTTTDVFIKTAHKGRQESIGLFLIQQGHNYFGVVPDDELEELFDFHKDLECILISIDRV
jgi:hypothetical protein